MSTQPVLEKSSLMEEAIARPAFQCDFVEPLEWEVLENTEHTFNHTHHSFHTGSL